MNTYSHTLHTLWARFRWEWLAFLALVLIAAVLDFMRPETASTLHVLEWLWFFWLTSRLLLAQEGFKTFGGWRTRPISRGSFPLVVFSVLVVLWLVALAVKGATLWFLYHPTQGQWIYYGKNDLRPLILSWGLFVCGVCVVSFFLRDSLSPAIKRTAWALGIIGFACVIFTGARNYLIKSIVTRGVDWPQENVRLVIREWFKQPDERVIRYPIDRAQLPIEMLASFSVVDPQTVVPGFHLKSLTTWKNGTVTNVKIDTYAMSSQFARRLYGATPVLVFKDGSYSLIDSFLLFAESEFMSMEHPEGNRVRLLLKFLKPLGQVADTPEIPYEVIFFLPKEGARFFKSAQETLAIVNELPKSAESLPMYVNDLMDACSEHVDARERELIRSLPPEAIDPILAYHPWSDEAWQQFVLPFLIQHADETHKPALLKRLAVDARLIELFRKRGWKEDAISVLKQRVREHQDVDFDTFILLCKQPDPELVDGLVFLTLRRNFELDFALPALRKYSSFDWPSFVAHGWRARKYGDYNAQGWKFANWAAQLGDASALRRMAEEAAAGKAWEKERLKELIPTSPDDPVPFLRKNLTKLVFHGETSTWALP